MRKKTSIIIGVIVAVIIVAIGGGIAVSGVLNPYEKQIKLGYKMIDEGKYEEAILAFNTAIEIDTKRENAYTGLAYAYVTRCDESAVDDASDALKRGYEKSQSMDIAKAYVNVAQVLLDKDKKDWAIMLLEKGYNVTSNEEIKSKLSEIEIRYNKNDYERSYGNSVNNFYKKNQVAMYNEKIYYNNPFGTGLKSIGVDGKNSETLNNDKPSFINVYKDKLYYVNTIDEYNNELISVDLDGKGNRTIIDKNVKSALITNNKLVYGVKSEKFISTFEGGYAMNFNVVNLSTSKKDTIEAGYENIQIIDENIYEGYSPPNVTYFGDIRKGVNRNDQRIFPIDENKYHYNMTFMGSNDKVVIAQLNEFISGENDVFSNKLFTTNKNGQGVENILPKIKDQIKSYILVGDEFYYYQGNDFYCYNLKNGSDKKLFESNYKSDDLFEFNGVIYETGDPLTPLYDTKEKILLKYNFNDNNIDRQNQEITANEAKDLVAIADKESVDYYTNLGLVLTAQETKTSEVKRIKEFWGIDEEGYNVYYSAPNEEMGDPTVTYFVGKMSKEVYWMPNEGFKPAYLMKDGKKVKELPWLAKESK